MKLFNLHKIQPSYHAVKQKYDSLSDYLIEDYPYESKSVKMFFDMINIFKKMRKQEKKENKKPFLDLIRTIDDITIEEYGRGHILTVLTYEYLTGVRKI